MNAKVNKNVGEKQRKVVVFSLWSINELYRFFTSLSACVLFAKWSHNRNWKYFFRRRRHSLTKMKVIKFYRLCYDWVEVNEPWQRNSDKIILLNFMQMTRKISAATEICGAYNGHEWPKKRFNVINVFCFFVTKIFSPNIAIIILRRLCERRKFLSEFTQSAFV